MLLPIIMVFFALMGCAEQAGGDEAMRLTEAADGTAIEVYQNGGFTVDLESNPTTGYMWAVVELDGGVVEEVGHEYHADPNPEMMTGTGGREEWVFRAVAPGTAQLVMHYRRHWEPDDPDGTFTLTVTVK